MSLETSIAKLCYSLDCAADSATPKEIKSAIKSSALIGGIVLAIPLWGLDTIIYACVLWGMYSKVAKIAGVEFNGNLIKNIIIGFITNIVICFILNFIFDFIVVLGWIGMFFVGYLSIKYSATTYLGLLELFHGKSKMRSRLDYSSAQRAFQESGGSQAIKGAVKSAAINELKDAF